MEVPEQWRECSCDDYFHEGWFERVRFDEPSQALAVDPLVEADENADVGFFGAGRSACDGVDVGYRRGHAGLSTFYPIDCELRLVAATVAGLMDRWCSAHVRV